ncbi:alpha/beta hydrolase fold domain-containing protein [Sarocladium implicatum]|nr:alpha/beta hydrolase fold domain-containing protein [Sarocladium implicatum]
MEFAPNRAVIHTEGCGIHYWYQGTGPLILFVPGGNGHGLQYNTIMARLSDRFTVATFDRRQMSASQTPNPKRMSPPQQARDMLAVMRAVGFEKATIFGSSGGGILAFQFALDFPQHAEHIIAHEAPTTLLLPDASVWYEMMIRYLEIRDEEGFEAAQAVFNKCLIGYDDEGVPQCSMQGRENLENAWKYEVQVFSSYLPNLWRIKEQGTSVGLMRGVRSRDAFYARTTYEQEKILGCLRMDVPGHHQGFEVEVDTFLPAFLDMLKQLEERRREAV